MKGELNKDRTPPWAVHQGSIMVPGKARLQLQSEYYNLITIFLKMLTFSIRGNTSSWHNKSYLLGTFLNQMFVLPGNENRKWLFYILLIILASLVTCFLIPGSVVCLGDLLTTVDILFFLNISFQTFSCITNFLFVTLLGASCRLQASQWRRHQLRGHMSQHFVEYLACSIFGYQNKVW